VSLHVSSNTWNQQPRNHVLLMSTKKGQVQNLIFIGHFPIGESFLFIMPFVESHLVSSFQMVLYLATVSSIRYGHY